MDEYIGLIIAAAIGALPGVLALIVQSKKRNAEIDCAEAEAAESYASVAKSYAAEVISLRKEINELRKELFETKKQVRDQDREIQDLRDWAERLVHQVQSLGSVPVEMRKVKRLRNEC